MASLSLLLRLPFTTAVILLFLAATATARCRSFLISSYSVRNPSSNSFTTITEIRSLTPLRIADLNNNRQPSFQIIDDTFFDPLPRRHVSGSSNNNLQLDPRASLPRASLGFSTADYAFASLRDRTKDILSVVIALLFGVGCGALTAATMYLVWSVFAGRRGYRSSAYDDFSSSDDDSEIESPKKMGYVKIPAAEAAAVAPPPPAAAAAKDSV